MSTIPVSSVVNVSPNVLKAGGSALKLSGLFLTTSRQAPVGQVVSLGSAAAVGGYFGLSSAEKRAADVYFAGFDNSNAKPGAMLFAQYPTSDVGAFLRGGSVASMTLTQLQALTGLLAVTIDGVAKTGSPNLAGATSFSNAGAIIGTTLGISGPQSASFTGSIAGTVLTVSAMTSGSISVGDSVVGASAGTVVSSVGTGTGGVGTYNVNNTQTLASGALTTAKPAVTFDSVSGAFTISSPTVGASSTIGYASGSLATSLRLTQVTGAQQSPGSLAATPAAFMTGAASASQSWKLFTTMFDPDNGSGNAQKYAFATWNGQQNNRYMFVPFDTDGAPAASNNAPSSLGALLKAANVSGTFPMWQPSNLLGAAFVCGLAASIDFTQRNGRTNFKFKSQSGLIAGVSDLTTAQNLAANGYNYYGVYGNAGEDSTFLAEGTITGDFRWADSYVNQIWLNGSFTSALLALLKQAGSVPYNAAGRAMIEAALADVINQGLDFGAYRSGVALSSSQAASVNAAAGKTIDNVLSTRGWYLQVGDATPEVRAARGSPPCTFWYVDGQSVNTINLGSVVLQ